MFVKRKDWEEVQKKVKNLDEFLLNSNTTEGLETLEQISKRLNGLEEHMYNKTKGALRKVMSDMQILKRIVSDTIRKQSYGVAQSVEATKAPRKKRVVPTKEKREEIKKGIILAVETYKSQGKRPNTTQIAVFVDHPYKNTMNYIDDLIKDGKIQESDILWRRPHSAPKLNQEFKVDDNNFSNPF